MDEEPCEGKLSCTVLKTSRRGDSTAEFNPSVEDTAESPAQRGCPSRVLVFTLWLTKGSFVLIFTLITIPMRIVNDRPVFHFFEAIQF